jgi:hypothetical protein
MILFDNFQSEISGIKMKNWRPNIHGMINRSDSHSLSFAHIEDLILLQTTKNYQVVALFHILWNLEDPQS